MASDATTRREALLRRLGLAFQQPRLLEQALTHRSFASEHDSVSNERLEFLGDAVLDLLVAEALYHAHPAWPEGDLSKAKSVVVGERSLEVVARRWEIGAAVVISRGEEQSGGRERRALLADAVEAVIGAYFLDQGFEACRTFVLRELGFLLEDIALQEHGRDYKTELQEVFQARYQAAPTYEVVQESGPPHDRVFTVAVIFRDQALGSGEGKSKKEAEQHAAADTLRSLCHDEQAPER